MITIQTSQLAAVFLVSIRIGLVLVFSPIEIMRKLPRSARIFIVLGLSVFLVINLSLNYNYKSELNLFISALIEAANGIILLLSLSLLFMIFQLAGQLMDVQAGFNSLAIFNPTEQSYEPILSRLLTLIALYLFFFSNAHHCLLQGLAFTFTKIALGNFAFSNEFKVLNQLIEVSFRFGWSLANPLIVGLLAIDLSTAALTRTMPLINGYFLTLPFKILLSFILLAASVSYLNPLAQYLFPYYFESLAGGFYE